MYLFRYMFFRYLDTLVKIYTFYWERHYIKQEERSGAIEMSSSNNSFSHLSNKVALQVQIKEMPAVKLCTNFQEAIRTFMDFFLLLLGLNKRQEDLPVIVFYAGDIQGKKSRWTALIFLWFSSDYFTSVYFERAALIQWRWFSNAHSVEDDGPTQIKNSSSCLEKMD